MTQKKQEKTIEQLENDIIDNCLEILTQNNIIVYSSIPSVTATVCNNADFLVYSLDKNKLPDKIIFKVLGPLSGCGLILKNIHIKVSFIKREQREKITKLYSNAEKKYYKQEKMRLNIENMEHINSLKNAQNNLQSFIRNSTTNKQK